VFIRPESIELTRPIEAEPLKAVIVEKTFLGEKVDYLLDLEGRRLNATSYDPLRHGTFSLHQQVGVRFNPDAITLLKGKGV
jgi:ABC-type Fe3+/spermidine/putrescine transport system ATPase subunit